MKAKFLIFLVCVSWISRANAKRLKPFIEPDEDNMIDAVFDDGKRVSATVAKTVTKFTCVADLEDAELLVYGTKAWRFPEQDVNLTLTYPPDPYKDVDDYMITGFKVLLFVDTVNTEGFINSGGLFKESVSLSFVSAKVNMLFYQFWLYGTPKSNPMYPSYIVYDLC